MKIQKLYSQLNRLNLTQSVVHQTKRRRSRPVHAQGHSQVDLLSLRYHPLPYIQAGEAGPRQKKVSQMLILNQALSDALSLL